MRLFQNSNFNFLRWRWHAVALSWLIIIAGIVVISTKGMPKGIEFAGGTSVIAQFDQAASVDSVRQALNTNFPGGGQNALVQAYGDASLRQVMVRVPQVGAQSGTSLSTVAKTVEDSLRKGSLPPFKIVGTEIVGPSVGEDLTRKGTSAMVLSLLGILAYIAFRFQFSFATGAVIATIHDLLVTLAFLAFFQYDITLNVIAAILTVTGYSTNDTIVIFDRVRENMRTMRRESLSSVVNASINQTLGRTILTGGLTLLSAIALFVFGGEVLRGFSFAMIVGVITGTYSSVFVASAIVTVWGRGSSSPVAASDAGAAAAAPPPRRSKSPRKARAS